MTTNRYINTPYHVISRVAYYLPIARFLRVAASMAALIFAFTFYAVGQCHFLDFSFESNNTSPATDPGVPVVADFNRDGKLDAVWPNRNADTITVALGDGAGDFSSVTNITVGDQPFRILIGDLNRDGRSDLVVSAIISVSILLGNGNGTFTLGPAPSFISPSALADFNRDGIPDILTTFTSTFRVFLGDGAGAYTAQTPVPVDGQNSRAVVADLNRDGREDVIISQTVNDRIAVFLATPTGFGTQTNFGVGNPNAILTADIDNDSRLDLLVGRNSATTDVGVLLGNGAGSFGVLTEFETGFSPQSLAVGDFDGDGKSDLVTGSESGGTPSVRVLPNIGNGAFGAHKQFFTGGGPHNVAVGDFDNDGKDDIFTTEQNTDTFGVLRNTCSGRAEVNPDFTGDGKADIAFFRPSTGFWFILRSEDNAFFSFPFGANGDVPAAADFDGDRISDAAVYRASIGTWFIRRSTGGTVITQFGSNSDIPVPNHYDGDGEADIAIYRPGNGEWWVQRSTAGLTALQFGAPGDIPIR